MFFNFVCGEVQCLSATSYEIVCVLCQVKFEFTKFPKHFENDHLSCNEIVKSSTDVTDPIETDTSFPFDEIKCESAGNSLEIEQLNNYKKSKSEKITELEEKEESIRVCQDDINSSDNIESDEKLQNESSYPCDTFGRHYKTKHSLKSHRSFDHPARKKKSSIMEYKWEDCGEKFNQESHLRAHMLRHNETYQNEESIEDTTVSKDHIINSNIKKDESSRNESSSSFPCDVCGRQYKTKHSLKSHRSRKHTAKKNQISKVDYKCTECGEQFRMESHLRGHMLKHTGIYCDICGKKFTQLGNMNRHKIRHTGIKAFKCETCSSTFFTEKELNAHKLRHTQAYPVICEICGKRCRESGVLTAHMRRHTGERPAKCDICSKSFYSFHDLNVHKVIHSKERPFVCDCGASFQRKKSLRIHKKTHSNVKNHVCNVCSKAFSQFSSLKTHMKVHE